MLALVLTQFTFGQTLQAKWQATPLLIDGKADDWQERPAAFDDVTGILYATYNDGESLYFTYEIPQQSTQMKIMRMGLELGFNVKAKPKVKASLSIPASAQEQGGPGGMGAPGEQGSPFEQGQEGGRPKQPNMAEMQLHYLMGVNTAEIDGFLHSESFIRRDIKNKGGFTFNLGWSEDTVMHIEIQVPIQEVLASTTDKYQLYVETVIPGMEAPSGMGGSDGGMGGGPGGGMGGGPGGGMGGGMGGPPPGGMGGGMGPGSSGGPDGMDMESMSSTQKFRYKLVLAEPQGE